MSGPTFVLNNDEDRVQERTRNTSRAGAWVAAVLVLGSLLGLWALDSGGRAHRAAVAAETVPAWVLLDEERYPCPAGERRTYMQFGRGLWQSNCVGD